MSAPFCVFMAYPDGHIGFNLDMNEVQKPALFAKLYRGTENSETYSA